MLVRCSVNVVHNLACVPVSYEGFPHFLVGAPTSHCVDPALRDAHVFHVVHDDDCSVSCGQVKAGEVDGVAGVRRVGVDRVDPLTCCTHCCFPLRWEGRAQTCPLRRPGAPLTAFQAASGGMVGSGLLRALESIL